MIYSLPSSFFSLLNAAWPKPGAITKVGGSLAIVNDFLGLREIFTTYSLATMVRRGMVPSCGP